MEQLDKEVIDELSEPAKRVFRSLDYRSQRRMLRRQRDGKTKKEKNTAKERGKKKSITKSKKRKSRRKREAVLLREIKVELPLLSDGNLSAVNNMIGLKEPLLLVHFKSFRYSDGEQPFCL